MSTANTLLKQNGLRTTGCRNAVLDLFMRESHALSHAQIEGELTEQYDRVTIYRTLSTFAEHGLIHKVLDDSESAKYALCESECGTDHHHDNHVHFKCKVCLQSECVNDVRIPDVKLPAGYRQEGSNLLIEGVCKRCAR